MPAGRRHAVFVGAAIAILMALGVVFAGCAEQSPATGLDYRANSLGAVGPTAIEPGAAEPTVANPQAIDPTATYGLTSASSRILEITVGPARRECYGPFRRMCLIVDGSFFYDEIEGFNHKPGNEYQLRIERYDAFPGQKELPQDAGRYNYRLLEVISKTRVSGAVRDVHVAPARVQCPKTDERCLLVDGQPIRNSIDGFDHRPGFDYHIRLESYDDGTRRMVEVIDRTPAESTVEEISVGPGRVDCYEGAPITAACIVVNGQPYYGVIEEFARRHGYQYRLRVEKYDLFAGQSEPPPELPRYGYRLLAELSETRATRPPSGN